MNTKHIVATAIAVAAIVLAGLFLWSRNVVSAVPTDSPDTKEPSQRERQLEHRRETWISALEWCESRAKNEALNPKDRDGTPSYSNFQWKPSTFLGFGKLYGLIATSTTLEDVPELLKNYELQRDIVRHMIPDKDVDWYQQFPDCIKTKIGLPPIK